MIASPKVATYDLKPEMSAYEVTDALLPEIKIMTADFICSELCKCRHGWSYRRMGSGNQSRRNS